MASIIFLGWLLIIPVFLWTTQRPLDTIFSEWRIFTLSLGQLLGLLGTVLFSLAFFLNTRLGIIEEYFKGLNRVYSYHHLVGKTAFAFILLHPILISISSIAQKEGLAINFGILAYTLFLALMVVTLLVRIPYHIWRKTHRLLGFVLFFAGAHILLVPSDVASNAALKIYILSIMIIGALSYFYKTLFEYLTIRKYDYLVEKVVRLTRNIVEVTLSPKNTNITYTPGQFVFVEFNSNNLPKEPHPFSLVSYPNDKSIRLGIKALGDYSEKIVDLKRGDSAKIEGPYGRFASSFDPKKEQLWIAGGIGITPFISMTSLLPGQRSDINLIYSVKKGSEAAYLDLLKKIAERYPLFKLHLWESDKLGLLTAEGIGKLVGNLTGKEYYICGPSSMMAGLKNQLLAKSIPVDCIHTEEFKLI